MEASATPSLGRTIEAHTLKDWVQSDHIVFCLKKKNIVFILFQPLKKKVPQRGMCRKFELCKLEAVFGDIGVQNYWWATSRTYLLAFFWVILIFEIFFWNCPHLSLIFEFIFICACLYFSGHPHLTGFLHFVSNLQFLGRPHFWGILHFWEGLNFMDCLNLLYPLLFQVILNFGVIFF